MLRGDLTGVHGDFWHRPCLCSAMLCYYSMRCCILFYIILHGCENCTTCVQYSISYHTILHTVQNPVLYHTVQCLLMLWCNIMLWNVIQYYTTLHNTILYYTMLYYTILYDTTRCILYCIVFYNAVLNHTTVSHTILYNIFLCAALYHTILYYTIQNIPSYFEATVFYAIPCYNIPYDMFSATKLVRLCPLTVLDATLSILHDSPRVLQNWYTAGETEMGAPPLPQKNDGRWWAPMGADLLW